MWFTAIGEGQTIVAGELYEAWTWDWFNPAGFYPCDVSAGVMNPPIVQPDVDALVVPEPGGGVMLASGALGLIALARRRHV